MTYELNKPQKVLLKEYINNVSNTNSLKEYIKTFLIKKKFNHFTL